MKVRVVGRVIFMGLTLKMAGASDSMPEAIIFNY